MFLSNCYSKLHKNVVIALSSSRIFSTLFSVLNLRFTGFKPQISRKTICSAQIIYQEDSRMFAWGSTVHGELGLGGIEDEQILAPRLLEWVAADVVIQIACGDNHTLLLTKDGKVYSCGNNDYGQLGHEQPRKRPRMSIFSM